MNTSSNSSDRELITSRLIQASPRQILQAIQDPVCLAQWWGPAGFRNTFHEFECKPGGVWRFDMHGPDGKTYPNKIVFEEISEKRVVLCHLEPVHRFVLTMALEPENHGTRLTWRQAFDSAAECDRVRPYAPRCNEENLDRLESVLAEEASNP